MNKTIKITRNGPYQVQGKISLHKKGIVSDISGAAVGWQNLEENEEIKTAGEKVAYSLCRCGKSKDKPFCDGSHEVTGFKGEETASKAGYLDLVEEIIDNQYDQEIELLDASSLCAVARFCHPNGGTWRMVQNASNEEEKLAAVKQACACPAGRLIVRDKKTGKLLEEKLEKEIIAVEDLAAKKMGPLHVKGGIELESADGEKYSKRNQMTLCRCGRSRNKPFCDGSHMS